MAYDKNRIDLANVPRPYEADEPVFYDGVIPPIRIKRVGDVVQWALKADATQGESLRNEPAPTPESDWEPASSSFGGADIVTIYPEYTGTPSLTLPFVPQKIVAAFVYNYAANTNYTGFQPFKANGDGITDGYTWNGTDTTVGLSSPLAGDKYAFILQKQGSNTGGGGGGGITNITGYIEQGENVTITGAGTLDDPYIINTSGGGGGTGEESRYRGLFSAQAVKTGWVFESNNGGFYEALQNFNASAEPTPNAFWRKVNIGTVSGGFSGNYNDLTNKPALFSGDYNDLTNKPDLTGIVGVSQLNYSPVQSRELVFTIAETLTFIQASPEITDLKIQVNGGTITTLALATAGDYKEWTGSIAIPAKSIVKWIPTSSTSRVLFSYETHR